MYYHRNTSNTAKFGFYISVITTILTVITFGIAISTPPLSGPLCKAGCFQYPYNDIMSRFPRDYYWMFSGIILTFSYLIMMITVHHSSSDDKKLFNLTGVSFFCLVPVFSNSNRLEKCIRWTFIISFIMMIVSLISVLLIYGVRSEYRIEVIIKSITWIELIITGVLLLIYFNQKSK